MTLLIEAIKDMPDRNMMMKKLIVAVCVVSLASFLGLPAACAAETSLEVGDAAPVFEAQDDEGKSWSSKDHVGQKILVVYFYPADMTGGCTAQACGYRDNLGKLNDKNVMVVGVSGDTVENHQWFKKAHDLNFTLLADVDGTVAKKFGVPITEGEKVVTKVIFDAERMLKRNVTAKRWTFVIDTDGKIAYKDDQVKAKQDPEKILDVVAGLK